MITKELIGFGIKHGTIRFTTDPIMESGTVCGIGEHWFYFGGLEAEGCTLEEYLDATPVEDLIDEVYAVMEAFRQDTNTEDEYRYYDAYLAESFRAATQNMPTLRQRDTELEKMWDKFADVPMDPETERLDADFMHFPAGTDREDVWHWFDERHSKGIVYLLYRNYATDAEPLLYRKRLCTECDAEHCVFNPEGICRLPFVTGAAPRLSDDGCADYCYKEET